MRNKYTTMKWAWENHYVTGILLLAAAFLWCGRGFADPDSSGATVFIGTRSVHQGQGDIMSCRFDPASGRLSAAKLAMPATDSNFLAVSPCGRFLFVANGRENVLASCLIGANGDLLPINRQPVGSRGPCHLWATATHLFSANYSGGSVTVCPVGSDGSLGAPAAVVSFSGRGPDARWQDRPYAHGVCTDASGRHVYVCDRGSDRVWSLRLSPDTGYMKATEPPAGCTPPGSGPRHALVGQDGRFLYANSEMGRDVSVFARDPESGALTWRSAHPVLPDPEKRGGWTSELALHPSGRWLYVSVRGHNLLSLFSVARDGALAWRENVPAGVIMPRSFVLDASGRWLIVGGVEDNRLQVHRIDPATGRLALSGKPVPVAAPYCVVIRNRPER
ncbi:3-carboxymuconate cyclase [Opitutaceae bacterium TAV1]|nr:3-carboxymuconate cyclase [Opitutaceae bacterium TAV1]